MPAITTSRTLRARKPAQVVERSTSRTTSNPSRLTTRSAIAKVPKTLTTATRQQKSSGTKARQKSQLSSAITSPTIANTRQIATAGLTATAAAVCEEQSINAGEHIFLLQNLLNDQRVTSQFILIIRSYVGAVLDRSNTPTRSAAATTTPTLAPNPSPTPASASIPKTPTPIMAITTTEAAGESKVDIHQKVDRLTATVESLVEELKTLKQQSPSNSSSASLNQLRPTPETLQRQSLLEGDSNTQHPPPSQHYSMSPVTYQRPVPQAETYLRQVQLIESNQPPIQYREPHLRLVSADPYPRQRVILERYIPSHEHDQHVTRSAFPVTDVYVPSYEQHSQSQFAEPRSDGVYTRVDNGTQALRSPRYADARGFPTYYQDRH
jgi:hypothetical protein